MNDILDTFENLEKKYPFILDFFTSQSLEKPVEKTESPFSFFSKMDSLSLAQKGIKKENLSEDFLLYISHMKNHTRTDIEIVQSITIRGGQNKAGEAESCDITLQRGDVISLVGQTGSGKSRFLSDIEWLAQGDTPTKRHILINGHKPPESWRFSMEQKLVAQLSQNMNFVMDVSVGDFIKMHAESRMIPDCTDKKNKIIEEANKLAGEPLNEDMPVTALSGGQSRALMIADTAFLSTSPIVLIDEIENAGIDRSTAVKLLIQNGKIIIIATHDPSLALLADRRIVIKNGGISKILSTTAEEKNCLQELERINNTIALYREKLRNGEELHQNY